MLHTGQPGGWIVGTAMSSWGCVPSVHVVTATFLADNDPSGTKKLSNKVIPSPEILHVLTGLNDDGDVLRPASKQNQCQPVQQGNTRCFVLHVI